MTSCAVQFCENKPAKTENLSYFRFPTDTQRCKQWLDNCQTERLFEKDPAALPHNYRVCGVHFESRMFLNRRKKNRLTFDAVPTIFSDKILLEREKKKKIEAKKDAQTFGTEVKTEPYSSTSTEQFVCSALYNEDKSTAHTTTDASDCPSASNILLVSNSDSPYQTPLHRSNKIPKTIKHKNELKTKNKEIKELKKKINALTQQVTQFNTIEQMLTLCKQYLPPSLFVIINTYVSRRNRKVTGYRYCNEFKKIALTINFLSPKVYTFLRSTLGLPNPCTLRRMTQGHKIHPTV